MKALLIGVVVTVLTLAGVAGLNHHSHQAALADAEIAHRTAAAAQARVAGLAVQTLFRSAEASEGQFYPALSAAQHEVREFDRVATGPREEQVSVGLNSLVSQAVDCRDFMLHASVESLRLNPPCSQRAQEISKGLAEDVVAIRAGDSVPRS